MKFLAFAIALLLPSVVFAGQFFGPIVPSCTEAGAGFQGICQACNLVKLVDNLLKFFVTLAVVGAAVMFAYAGILYVTASANKKNIDSAHSIFRNVFIGLVLIVIAFLFIDLVMRVFTGQTLKVWSTIQCVNFNPVNGGFQTSNQDSPIGGSQGTTTTPTSTPPTTTPGGPICTSGRSSIPDALSQVNGNTSYYPGGGGMQGADIDAYGRPIYTVQDCKNDMAAGRQCKPITVAVPQDMRDQCGMRGNDVVTWDALARSYGLPPGTKFQMADVYGCYWKDPNNKALGAQPRRYDGVTPCNIGRTPTGGLSFDVATCARPRNNPCNSGSPNLRNIPPPVLVPGG